MILSEASLETMFYQAYIYTVSTPMSIAVLSYGLCKTTGGEKVGCRNCQSSYHAPTEHLSFKFGCHI